LRARALRFVFAAGRADGPDRLRLPRARLRSTGEPLVPREPPPFATLQELAAPDMPADARAGETAVAFVCLPPGKARLRRRFAQPPFTPKSSRVSGTLVQSTAAASVP